MSFHSLSSRALWLGSQGLSETALAAGNALKIVTGVAVTFPELNVTGLWRRVNAQKASDATQT